MLVRPRYRPGQAPASTRALSLGEIEEILGHANEEFRLLRAAGITPAPAEWLTVKDRHSNHRTLARVAIYDGERYPEKTPSYLTPEEQALLNDFADKSSTYLNTGLFDDKLYDVSSPSQHLHSGAFRDATVRQANPDASICLVDIEPMFRLR